MKSFGLHEEGTFESAIEDSLLAHGGYVAGDADGFDAGLGLWPAEIVAFLRDSQPDAWAKLQDFHGGKTEASVVNTIAGSLNNHGTLHVLRHGVTDHGVKLRLAYFQPASTLNPDLTALYAKNRLTVTRQVHYHPAQTGQSIDMVLAVNGLPVATAELKQPFTGQTWRNAIKQYREDRDAKAPLLCFKTRALVHFAVDPDEVWMTTRLAGKRTRFLPFNRGRDGGAGNPDNPEGYRTAYLWEEVWARNRWMDILRRFIHLEVTEREVAGKKQKSEALIFPRYHQLDAVLRLEADARASGAGNNYLIQHSAGSGKSNTIAWLAHRLSSLHDADDNPVFDSVVVVTDRRVLDKQLRENIYQFEHKQGVVEAVTGEGGSKSAALAEAFESGKRIVICTLQTYTFVKNLLDAATNLSSRRFAVIVDEAHSSQTGESAADLKRVLGSGTDADNEQEPDQETDIEDEILKEIAARGQQDNLSFFAFTATPKKRTLEMFGEIDTSGHPSPFHLYPMRQAIEEGFILDVLRHYMTYQAYYRLEKSIEDDPDVDKAKARRAIARYMSLHPHNLSQKAEVMIEHFRAFTRHKIGGAAKAMLVTRSRLHAVRYKRTFDDYIAKQGYDDMKVLVAFSGTVQDEGEEYTEAAMNGFGERELPERFAGPEYQLLIVAEKYQTGFDQPLLHTMYVDKKLAGLNAVQTLSRLNRVHPAKEDTFILDFENEVEDIKQAFQPYYERTEIDEPTDPNLLYTLKTNLEGFQYFWQQEVADFAAVFFKPSAQQVPADQGKLHAIVDQAVKRFAEEPDEERREEFRSQLASFIRLYGFLSQVIAFADADLEKLYAYARLLRKKLPRREDGGILDLDDDVELTYYRLTKTGEHDARLQEGVQAPVTGPGEVGTAGTPEEAESPLSAIIKTINDRYGTDWTEGDKVVFDQVVEDLLGNETLREQARHNSMEQFRHAFDPAALQAFIRRMERYNDISETFMSNGEIRGTALALMMREYYQRARRGDETKGE
jgi:type I restriction enzyme R subunit